MVLFRPWGVSWVRLNPFRNEGCNEGNTRRWRL